ncbi:hypothetical protein F5Y05DRAFT_418803 [Hypoxylon sp. FL0543]|nr:hypothetical protein F5Y05DRAFT_418803 [Hypoxylon sp. FL0543]
MARSRSCHIRRRLLRSRTAQKRHTNYHRPRRTGHRRHYRDCCQHFAQARMNGRRRHASYFCCKCSHEYSDMRALNLHCCECKSIFDNDDTLEDHRESHLSPRPELARPERPQLLLCHRCPHCPAAFRKKLHLETHLAQHMMPKIPCVAAPDCASSFEHPEDMIEHFDLEQCGSQMSLNRAYARAQPNVIPGGRVTRLRAERWAYRYFEKHEEQSE